MAILEIRDLHYGYGSGKDRHEVLRGLEASFEQAAEEVKAEAKDATLEEMRSRIESEMMDFFKEKQAEIRQKRIELYVDEQIKAKQKK